MTNFCGVSGLCRTSQVGYSSSWYNSRKFSPTCPDTSQWANAANKGSLGVGLFSIAQFMDSPIQLWVLYTSTPSVARSIIVANPLSVQVTARVQKNDATWTLFTLPPFMPPTRVMVNSANYLITVDANGNIDVAPNIEVF